MIRKKRLSSRAQRGTFAVALTRMAQLFGKAQAIYREIGKELLA
jgi:hypothetical protein